MAEIEILGADSFMTDEKYTVIKDKLNTALANLKQVRFAPDISEAYYLPVIKAIQASEVPALGADKRSNSTANCPIASKYWAIGFLGSVWLDVKVKRKIFRVAFNPANSQMHIGEIK